MKIPSEQYLNRLGESLLSSFRELEPFRQINRDIVEEWVGNRYGDQTKTQHKTLVNLLSTAIETFSIHMVPQRPQVNVTTDYTEYKSTAASLKIAINNEFENMNLESELEMIVTNAWLRMGIAKIGLTSGNYERVGNQVLDVGRLFVQSVSLDNWVHDVTATDFEKCKFYGDRYLITRDELEAMPLYDAKKHIPDSLNSTSADNGTVRLKELTQGENEHFDEDTSSKAEAWDLYLPYENIIITILNRSDTFSNISPLRVIKWAGPAEGPYKFLRFNRVPENALPMAIAPQLLDLHINTNNLHRKQLESGQRKKNVYGYKSSHRQDAEAIRNAADNEFVQMQDPSAVQEFKFGDIDQQVSAQLMMLDQLFDRQAGNLSMLAGLGPSAETVGQEQLIQSQSSARINLFKGKVRSFVREIAKDVAWWRWHDGNYNPPIFKEIPNTDMKIRSQLIRAGEFIDYNFDIEVHSMEYKPPSVKLNHLMSWLSQMQPFIPMMQQQGVNLNFEKLIHLFAEYSALPELKDIMDFAQPQIQEQPPMSMHGGSSPNTTRTYIRKNESSQTDKGFQKSMMAHLSGMNQQPNEAANMVRT